MICIYHSARGNLNGVHHISLSSVIITSQIVEVTSQYDSNASTDCYENWYVYHATRDIINGVLKKSLPSEYQYYNSLSNCRGNNLNITWMLESIFMKVCTYEYIIGPQAISTVYLINQSRIVLFYWFHYAYVLKFSFYFSHQILKL
jgi:hypothetical protein